MCLNLLIKNIIILNGKLTINICFWKAMMTDVHKSYNYYSILYFSQVCDILENKTLSYYLASPT